MMTNAILLATNILWGVMVSNVATSGFMRGDDAVNLHCTKGLQVRLQAGGSMSNIVETVVIVTNVTTTDNAVPAPSWNWQTNIIYTCTTTTDCSAAAAWTWPLQGQPATEKTETTEVVEVKTLRFKWDDQEHAIEHKRVLSRKVKRWVRKDNWVEE